MRTRAVAAGAALSVVLAFLVLVRPTEAVTCDNAPLANKPTVKVLVMGDSLTHGSAGDFTWRYRFWQAERAQGVNIDFVGPYSGLMPTWDSPGIENLLYADPCFDREHFAAGGKDLKETLEPTAWDTETPKRSQVAWATSVYQPDVVIGLMGYNDLKPAQDGRHGSTPDQLLASANAFVEQVRVTKPGTPVALSTVGSTKAPEIVVDGASYTAKLKAAVPTWSTPQNPVGIIDVLAGWKGVSETWDGYHPNANGELRLAWVVADGLAALGVVPALPRPIPVVKVGPRRPGSVRLVSRTPSSVKLRWTFPVGSDRESLYRRDVTAGTGWSKVYSELHSTGTTMAGLAAHQYQFRVQAAKGTAVATDLFSAPVVVDLRPLGRPLLKPAPGHRIRVTWRRAADTTRYQVRIRAANGKWRTAGWTRSTALTSPRLVKGRRYAVRVVGWDSYGAGRTSVVARFRVR